MLFGKRKSLSAMFTIDFGDKKNSQINSEIKEK